MSNSLRNHVGSSGRKNLENDVPDECRIDGGITDVPPEKRPRTRYLLTEKEIPHGLANERDCRDESGISSGIRGNRREQRRDEDDVCAGTYCHHGNGEDEGREVENADGLAQIPLLGKIFPDSIEGNGGHALKRKNICGHCIDV
jgi:hypothetical protein